MATNSKPVSAIDRAKAEDKIGPYLLTDEITIVAPTFEQAKAFDDAPTMDAKFEAWLGEDTAKAFYRELDLLPVHLVEPVLLDFLAHFFGEDAAEQLAASTAKARNDALAALTRSDSDD